MSDRGMMKWVPYKSLVEQDQELTKWRINKEKIEKPIIMEDKAAELNDFLVSYHDQVIIASYFQSGFIVKVKGQIKKIDLNDQSLLVDTTKIKLVDLLDLENVY